jgi:hypothetical protein
MGKTSCLRSAVERPTAPRLIGGLCPRLAVLTEKHELALGRPASGHAPGAQIRGERRQQSDGPMLTRVRVSLLTERH